MNSKELIVQNYQEVDELINPINQIYLILKALQNTEIINDINKLKNHLEEFDKELEKIKSILNIQNERKIDINNLLKIIAEEKYRIGKTDANLLAENITFRLKNNLWD